MSGLLISKANEKNNTIVTINGQGVFYQELRLGDRQQSPRVRLGKLVVVEGEGIVVDYDAVNDYESLLVRRDTDTRVLAATQDLLKTLTEKESIAIRQSEINQLEDSLKVTNESISNHPMRAIASFNATVIVSVDKMLDKVRYKHQSIETKDKTIKFTHYPNRAYFLQKLAEDLLLRHNENLENRGIEVGYMDFDTAIEVIKARFKKVTTTATPTATPKVTPTAATQTATTKRSGKDKKNDVTATPATI